MPHSPYRVCAVVLIWSATVCAGKRRRSEATPAPKSQNHLRHLLFSDAGGDFGVVGQVILEAIKRLDRVDDVTLTAHVRPWRAGQVQRGVARATQVDALKPAGEEAAVPLPPRSVALVQIVRWK